MIEKSLIEWLKKRKNLLAFSGGGDSSALFFLLLEHQIPFDIAIVDYATRKQSKEEVAYANELAQRYNLACYTHKAEKIEKNFEAVARKIRYDFFESLIRNHSYDTLLTAHHLGDRLEWFLMQFCKGAGCLELGGMQVRQQRENYTLVRPLLHATKEELRSYLHANSIRYFEDETNSDQSYMRNRFRHEIASPLLKEYANGIKRSFRYLDEDITALKQECHMQYIDDLHICASNSHRSLLFCIDKELKKMGYLLSRFEKEELKKGINTVVGRRYIIVFYNDYALIAPYVTYKDALPKKFKEECRLMKIEPKIRPFLYTNKKAFEAVKSLTPEA